MRGTLRFLKKGIGEAVCEKNIHVFTYIHACVLFYGLGSFVSQTMGAHGSFSPGLKHTYGCTTTVLGLRV